MQPCGLSVLLPALALERKHPSPVLRDFPNLHRDYLRYPREECIRLGSDPSISPGDSHFRRKVSQDYIAIARPFP